MKSKLFFLIIISIVLSVIYFLSKKSEFLQDILIKKDFFKEIKKEIKEFREYVHTLKTVHLIESFENEKEWELFAQEAKNKGGQDHWDLFMIEAFFYDLNSKQFVIKGQKAFFNFKERILKIFGNVTIDLFDSYVLKTEEIFYYGNTREIVSENPINIFNHQGTRKVLTGGGFRTFLLKDEMELVSGVEIKQNYSLKEELSISSLSSKVYKKKKLIEFVGDVKMNLLGSFYQSDQVEFFYHRLEQMPDLIVLKGNVKIHSKNRQIYCEKAILKMNEGISELIGNPIIKEEEKVIRGELIIIDHEQDIIEIKNIKAHIEK